MQTTELEQVALAAKSFASGTTPAKLETKDWTTHHWLHFLRSLPEDLSLEQMQLLDSAFQFTSTGNSEILHDWLLRVIQTKYEPGYEALESFLTRQGRRKFLEPLYRQLAATDAGLARGKSIYEKARPGYHAVSRETIDGILGVKE
ncbi:MAG: leukotriene A4 hydrolase C-terminal domain-containing protein [Planctomycetota bacterium]